MKGVLTLDDFCAIGELFASVDSPPPAELVDPVVVIDSREVKGGELFVALKGERTDGHSYIDTVFEHGASWAMVSREWHEAHDSLMPPAGKGFIVVPDSVAGLQQLARSYRSKFSIPVVAIGGSNGKTTTKEMVASVLATAFRVQMSKGNRNNHLGVPLTLLQLRRDTGIAVLELGINHPGEMELLAGIAMPSHALLTNIGHEHLEFLVDLEGVAAEETQLFNYLRQHGGTAFINADDPWLQGAGAGLDETLRYGIGEGSDALCQARDILVEPSGRLSFLLLTPLGSERVELNFTGKHNVLNAVAAATVGVHFGLSLCQIVDGLQKLMPAPGWKRLEVQEAGGLWILNDTYNANSDSMRLAIDALCDMPCRGRRVAVLGDMLELGAAGDSEHDTIGRYIQQCDVALLYTFGERARRISRAAPKCSQGHFESHEKLLEALLALLHEGDTVLFKGSRGMQLERVVDSLINEKTKP